MMENGSAYDIGDTYISSLLTLEQKMLLLYMSRTIRGTSFHNDNEARYKNKLSTLLKDLKITPKKFNDLIKGLWKKGCLGFSQYGLDLRSYPQMWGEPVGKVEELLLSEPEQVDIQFPDWVKRSAVAWRKHAIAVSRRSNPPASWSHVEIAKTIVQIVKKEKITNWNDLSYFIWNDDFWKNNIHVPKSLLKANSDGVRKIDQIKTRMIAMNVWEPKKVDFNKGSDTKAWTGKAVDALGRVINV